MSVLLPGSGRGEQPAVRLGLPTASGAASATVSPTAPTTRIWQPTGTWRPTGTWQPTDPRQPTGRDEIGGDERAVADAPGRRLGSGGQTPWRLEDIPVTATADGAGTAAGDGGAADAGTAAANEIARWAPESWIHQPFSTASATTKVPAAMQPMMTTASTTMTATAPPSEIRRAAIRLGASQKLSQASDRPLQTEPIQPGYSPQTLRRAAGESIQEAQRSLDTQAYLTAADRAVTALELIAQATDSRERSALATRDLKIALTAIREAEDFVGKYGLVDSRGIERMVRSHATEVLKPYDVTRLGGTAAADIYLDWARRCLSPLAASDPLAGEALRVLAHSHRLRDGGTPFGIATAVHLLRAASEADPANRSLSEDYEAALQLAGLSEPASSARAGQAGHWSYADPARTPSRPVQIWELTPEQFADVSPALSGPASSGPALSGLSSVGRGAADAGSGDRRVPGQLASARLPVEPSPSQYGATAAHWPAAVAGAGEGHGSGLLVDPAAPRPAPRSAAASAAGAADGGGDSSVAATALGRVWEPIGRLLR